MNQNEYEVYDSRVSPVYIRLSYTSLLGVEMSVANTRRILRWYEKNWDTSIGDEDLNAISLNELQNLFDVPSDNPMYDCWEVKEEHSEILQKYVHHLIDLNEFDYFVEATSIE